MKYKFDIQLFADVPLTLPQDYIITTGSYYSSTTGAISSSAPYYRTNKLPLSFPVGSLWFNIVFSESHDNGPWVYYWDESNTFLARHDLTASGGYYYTASPRPLGAFYVAVGGKTMDGVVFPTAVTVNDSSTFITYYTVSYNANGGSAVSSEEVEDGEVATKPTNPTKASNVFVGWYSDSGLTTRYDFSTTVTADITLYAKWVSDTSIAGLLHAEFETKVDKETGKGLSTEDYTSAEKTKLSNLTIAAEYDNIYYVSKEGLDTNDGKTENTAFLTIGKAITVIDGDPNYCIEVLDNGTYTENITLASYTSLYAPKATISGTIVANNGSNVLVCKHYASANSQTLFTNQGGTEHTLYKFVTNDCLTYTGVTNIKNQTNGAILFVDGEMLYSGLRGIQDYAGGGEIAGHIHFNIKDIYQRDNDANARAIDAGGTSSDIIGYVDHFLIAGTPTSPTAIYVAGGGKARITANEIDYTGYTAVNVGSGSEVYLNCLDIKGTVTEDGTYVTIDTDNVNVLEEVQIDSSALTVTDKAVNIPMATTAVKGVGLLSSVTTSDGFGENNNLVTETHAKLIYDDLDSTCDYLLGLLEA